MRQGDGMRAMSGEQTSRDASISYRGLPRLGLLVAALLLIAATAVGCGESDAEQAENQVCDSLADLNTQVNELATFTAATATTKDVQQQLDAIKNDLNDIKDAQGDLNEDRKQQVESANQEFSSQVKAVASDFGTSLSTSEAEAKLQSAAAQLKSSYQQTFAKIDCS